MLIPFSLISSPIRLAVLVQHSMDQVSDGDASVVWDYFLHVFLCSGYILCIPIYGVLLQLYWSYILCETKCLGIVD